MIELWDVRGAVHFLTLTYPKKTKGIVDGTYFKPLKCLEKLHKAAFANRVTLFHVIENSFKAEFHSDMAAVRGTVHSVVDGFSSLSSSSLT